MRRRRCSTSRRSAGSASRRTSLGRYASSAPRRRRSSRAEFFSSTAAWGCDVSSNGRRRVVITGLGCVSPLGNSVEDSWGNLLAGESGAAEITQFDHSNSAYNVHFACELKEFDPTVWIDRKAARRMDRFAQMILAAARQAESDCGVEIATEAERIGTSVATGIGGLKSFQDAYATLRDRGPDRVSPFAIP